MRCARDVKLEPVITFYGLKRGDMKDFLRAQPIFGCDGRQIIFIAKVAVPLAESVADLGNHHPQFVLRIQAEPKAHGIKHMTEHPWLRQK